VDGWIVLSEERTLMQRTLRKSAKVATVFVAAFLILREG